MLPPAVKLGALAASPVNRGCHLIADGLSNTLQAVVFHLEYVSHSGRAPAGREAMLHRWLLCSGPEKGQPGRACPKGFGVRGKLDVPHPRWLGFAQPYGVSVNTWPTRLASTAAMKGSGSCDCSCTVSRCGS